MAFQVEHQIEIPEGPFLRSKLEKLEVATIPYTDKKTGERKEFSKLNWTFEITEQGEFHGKTVKGESPAFLSDSPHNRFRNWAEALLQRPLDVGQVLNESDLEGLSAYITVKYESDRNDSSKKWARVDDVIPLDPGASDEPPF